jgi:hypothetical protein
MFYVISAAIKLHDLYETSNINRMINIKKLK